MVFMKFINEKYDRENNMITQDKIPIGADQRFLKCPDDARHGGYLFFEPNYPFKRCQVNGCGQFLQIVRVSKSDSEFKIEKV